MDFSWCQAELSSSSIQDNVKSRPKATHRLYSRGQLLKSTIKRPSALSESEIQLDLLWLLMAGTFLSHYSGRYRLVCLGRQARCSPVCFPFGEPFQISSFCFARFINVMPQGDILLRLLKLNEVASFIPTTPIIKPLISKFVRNYIILSLRWFLKSIPL